MILRTRRMADPVSFAKIPIETFSRSRGRSLSKKAQFGLCRFTNSSVQFCMLPLAEC
jgi:hypothetical protein